MSGKTYPSNGSCSSVGRVRGHNEDSFIVRSPLYAVADGMGGHEAGEVASEIAIDSLLEHAPAHPDGKALSRAVRAANKAVLRGVSEGVGKPGMGTTLTAAIVENNKIALAQVGDSRAYLLHEGILQRVTRDHSLVADLVERGIITETEARYHPKRSVITRALGSDEEMVPDVFEFEASSGDRLMLCSDGLSGMIDDDRIRTILMEFRDPQTAADELVKAANDAGGHDNITAIVVDIESESEASIEPWQVRKMARNVLLWVLAVVAVLAAAYGILYTYAQNSAYLIEQNGTVAVYRGIPGDVLGLTFSWPEGDTTTVNVDDLSESTQQKLSEGWPQDSVEDAKRTLNTLKEQAQANQRESETVPQTGSDGTGYGDPGTTGSGVDQVNRPYGGVTPSE